MYLIREVFRAKPGKAKNIVQVFKEVSGKGSQLGFKNIKVMTDIAARYWTVVIEYEVETLDQFAAQSRGFTSSPEMAAIFKGYLDYIKAGRREIYLLE